MLFSCSLTFYFTNPFNSAFETTVLHSFSYINVMILSNQPDRTLLYITLKKQRFRLYLHASLLLPCFLFLTFFMCFVIMYFHIRLVPLVFSFTAILDVCTLFNM